MSTIVSESSTWNPTLGVYVLTRTEEDFLSQPDAPENAVDVTWEYVDGKYRTSYKITSEGTGFNYRIQSTTSTEPLKTHPKFAEGGEWELSDDDLDKIKKAESGDPGVTWKSLNTGSGGLSAYASRAQRGMDSYLNPSSTLSITTDEDELPDLSDVGKIAEPEGAPGITEGSNWLFVGCTAEALTNGKWRISREYRASGTKGWDSDIYS